ncbi:MAG: type III pantothenate kinase [Phycisphaerae bacterium]
MTQQPQDETSRRIPNVLACDVGNSAVRMAVVAGEEVSDLRTFRVGELDGLGGELRRLWSQMPQPKCIVAASVNPAALKAVEAAAVEALEQKVLVVGRDIPLPMDTDLDSPESVGTDRVCAAVAAFDRLGKACVVADFGTAVTIDCVSDQGVFLGGAILPGLKMQADAMHERTAALPHIQPAEPQNVFGKDTTDAMLNGMLAAVRGALRYLVESYATSLGHWPVVVCTGGDAELATGGMLDGGLVQAIVPDLTLRGVAMAYYRTLLSQQ